MPYDLDKPSLIIKQLCRSLCMTLIYLKRKHPPPRIGSTTTQASLSALRALDCFHGDLRPEEDGKQKDVSPGVSHLLWPHEHAYAVNVKHCPVRTIFLSASG